MPENLKARSIASRCRRLLWQSHPAGKVLTDVNAFCEALLEEALVAVVPAPFGPGGERLRAHELRVRRRNH